MTNLRQDIQFGFRMLLKSRGLAVIAIFALALGIGANTAIFSVVNTVLLRALPYPQPDQLVWFWESQLGLEQGPFSAADFLDYQAQNQSFQQVATVRRLSFNLTGQSAAERIAGMVATPNVFSLLGVHPILGCDFVPEEGAFGSPRRALLTYGFWQSHLPATAPSLAAPSLSTTSPCKSSAFSRPTSATAARTFSSGSIRLTSSPRFSAPFPTGSEISAPIAKPITSPLLAASSPASRSRKHKAISTPSLRACTSSIPSPRATMCF